MALVWPARFPSPLLKSYSYSNSGDMVIRTKMDNGKVRTRQRLEDAPSIATVQFNMSQFNFGLFEAWFKLKAKNGASWFQMELPKGLGSGIESVRFLGSYKAKMGSHDIWQVNCKLEVQKFSKVHDERAIDLLLAGGDFAQLERAVKALDTSLNFGW